MIRGRRGGMAGSPVQADVRQLARRASRRAAPDSPSRRRCRPAAARRRRHRRRPPACVDPPLQVADAASAVRSRRGDIARRAPRTGRRPAARPPAPHRCPRGRSPPRRPPRAASIAACSAGPSTGAPASSTRGRVERRAASEHVGCGHWRAPRSRSGASRQKAPSSGSTSAPLTRGVTAAQRQQPPQPPRARVGARNLHRARRRPTVRCPQPSRAARTASRVRAAS